MNVEDSYEGAVRRLRRLGHAVDPTPTRALSRQLESTNERMRDLEELAALACDENDRLTRELDSSREEIDRLTRALTRLQAAIAPTEAELAVPSNGPGAWFYVLLLVVGVAAAASAVLRPWEHAQALRQQAQGLWARLAPSAPPPSPPVPPAPTPPPIEEAKAAAPSPQPAPSAPSPQPAPSAPVVEAAPVPAPHESEPQPQPAPPKVAAKSKPLRAHAAKNRRRKSNRHASIKRRADGRTGAIEAARKNDPLAGLDL
jgi:outer membrane biosynthesis protein TonB